MLEWIARSGLVSLRREVLTGLLVADCWFFLVPRRCDNGNGGASTPQGLVSFEGLEATTFTDAKSGERI